MTEEAIVYKAIEHLNRSKKLNLKILSCSRFNGEVKVKLKYPKPISWGNDEKEEYSFEESGFIPGPSEIDQYSFMEGFSYPERLIEEDPLSICILRIAYYFYKHGKDQKVI